MRSKSFIGVVAAVLGLTASAFSSRRPYDGFIGRKTLSQRHDPARVAAAAAKRERRGERNLRNAQAGGYGTYWAVQ